MANPPRIDLQLYRHADQAWREVIKPWLLAARGKLERSHVIVATRGQAHAFKQRCLSDGIPLLGVEFLTPGLARQKWRTLSADPKPVLGRELLLLGLRSLVEQRVKTSAPGHELWGFWRSLNSDPERALDDFDSLLKGGFRAKDFPIAPLREIFGEFEKWVESHGATFAPLEAEKAGLTAVSADGPLIASRVLVCGLGAEQWGEFFNVAAFVRRVGEARVLLPEPAFRGRADADEKWIEIWQELLGVPAQPLIPDAGLSNAEAVSDVWMQDAPVHGAAVARVLVGRTRGDEMALVADEIERLVNSGAEALAVIFPAADPAHLRLRSLLSGRGVDFADMLEGAAMPPVDVQAQRALLRFYAGGARIDDLLEIWPLLRAIGAGNDDQQNLTMELVRSTCERSFDELHVHSLAPHIEHWRKSRPALASVAEKLLPAWPAELALAEGLKRFSDTCEALGIAAPEGLGALEVFATKCTATEVFPAKVVLATLDEFLPAKSPPANALGKGRFSRVVLTTRRRAEGLSWSHLIFVESNAGVWPRRPTPSPWLTDEQKEKLNQAGRFSLGLFTAEQAAALEKTGYAQMARDTRAEVVFTAALFDEENPELPLAPNAWVERVLWCSGAAARAGGLEEAFAGLAEVREAKGEWRGDADREWLSIWDSRRDPERPFDQWFFSGNPERITPTSWAARRVESGVQDPAVLWFESVLGVSQVSWLPLVRARAKSLGQLAHAHLARALTNPQVRPGGFGALPDQNNAGIALSLALAEQRASWPADRYWDSFYAELTHACGTLLARAYEIAGERRWVAAEISLPAGTSIPCGAQTIELRGRMDLVVSDREGWMGADVQIIDFKTGGDMKLKASRMAKDAKSLQLALYLSAARTLGAKSGRVWMAKIEEGGTSSIGLEELDKATHALKVLEHCINTGQYGALTPDRGEYPPYGYEWPLACVRPARVLLDAKACKSGFSLEAPGDE